MYSTQISSIRLVSYYYWAGRVGKSQGTTKSISMWIGKKICPFFLYLCRSTSPIHAFVTKSSSQQAMTSSSMHMNRLPTMIVFDLDDCLWSPEMYTLRYPGPTIPVKTKVDGFDEELVTGMKCPNGPTVTLFKGARDALVELATDEKYKDVIIAAASSSEEPSFSNACLNNIEVIPGVTMRSMFQYDQIGRTGHLTSRKTTHFKALHEESGVAYNEMLFFDDCNWGDHVADVGNVFGVIGQRTPRGMQLREFHEGLNKYCKVAKEREAMANLS